MASWILSIDKDHPQHWGYAVDHGLWDLRTPRSIKAGDVVYFWQSGSKGGWVGRVEAAEDAYAINEAKAAPGPWDDWGTNSPKPYRARFGLNVIDSAASKDPKWAEVQTALGVNINPGWTYKFSPSQEAVLASYFSDSPAVTEHASPLDADYSDQERERDLEKFGYDLRRFTLRAIAMREGQPEFRRGLLASYQSRCAITGVSAEEVLEAAHISPYKGGQSNETHNGLLLRADIHTLFDRFLITVEPAHVVRVSPKLWATDYVELDGKDLICVPTGPDDRPDPELLRRHNESCDWLTS